MPAARHCSRSPTIALALGGGFHGARMVRVASKPSISGIWQSIRTRSKGCGLVQSFDYAPAVLGDLAVAGPGEKELGRDSS